MRINLKIFPGIQIFLFDLIIVCTDDVAAPFNLKCKF